MGKKIKPEEITMETVVQRDPEQEFSTIDGEVVMLSLKTGEYYALNSVASRIWEIMEEQKTIKELTEQLMEEYDVDPDTCVTDTLECLNDFQQKSLLKL